MPCRPTLVGCTISFPEAGNEIVAANNILLMRKRNHVFLLLAIALAQKKKKIADRFASRRYSLKINLGDRMIKQLLNSVIAKYIRICQCLADKFGFGIQIIDLLATDK